MKYLKIILVPLTVILFFSCKNEKSDVKTEESENVTMNDSQTIDNEQSLKITPIKHATMILESNGEVIFIDPTGGAEAFKGKDQPNLVLITDIHGDHLNLETLEALNLKNSTIIAPKAVIEKLPKNLGKTIVTLNNGDTYDFKTINIEAIPMYNLRKEDMDKHPKGRGNGYVLTIDDERIYISGDTEDIPEMRSLENIDKAFVCMNLPYTMPVENAADAVLEFKPNTVYPYHYRGADGFSDVDKFKSLVNQGDDSINVELLEWY
ncbi:MBL fold metallo-hydrolase [Winogradskyella ursingii]|uniref:MBL fold metallo-hydrolase n=1 Tax=Winogradskyella ursingii TaxID=2686079 RepID=UPI0015C8E68A|nr:MBL fold metallo-hydrolase [Winogradskyella ursingii]